MCRKALYIYKNVAERFPSARAYPNVQTEKLAQTDRDRRDPIKRRLQEIEDKKADRGNLLESKIITVADGADHYLRSQSVAEHGG